MFLTTHTEHRLRGNETHNNIRDSSQISAGLSRILHVKFLAKQNRGHHLGKNRGPVNIPEPYYCMVFIPQRESQHQSSREKRVGWSQCRWFSSLVRPRNIAVAFSPASAVLHVIIGNKENCPIGIKTMATAFRTRQALATVQNRSQI